MKTLKFSFNSFFSTLFILGFFLLFSIPAFGQCTNAECDQILIRNRNFKPNFCIDENIEIRLRNNTGGDCSDHYYIYIDDNNNSSYDVGEEIPLGSGSSDEILPSDLTQGGGIRQDYLIPITTINGILSTPLSGLEDLVNVTISLAVFSNGTYVCDGSVDQSFAITISNPPSITIPQAQEITCLNPFEILSINGLVNSSTDYTYVWVGPNITTGNNSGTPQINGSGDYFVTVTSDISGCTATATTTVLENTDAPTANINTTSSNDIITCSDLSVTLDASNSSVANSSTGTLSYLWSTGETTSMISVSTEDTYSVTITDSFNGCVDIASEIITENKDAPTANINITPSDGVITCSDSSVTLDASSSFVANSSTGVLSYLWSTGETTSMIFVSAEDTYSVTVTDSFNGCVDITSEIIVENSISPNITIPQAQDITCSNPFVTLSINGLVNPSTDYTYAWIGPDIIAGDNSGTPQINGPGDYSVTVTSNVNGCTATGTTTVIENTDTPTASVNTIPSNGKITCNDLSVTLNASSSSLANSSTGTLSYLWSTGEITSIISVSTASTYYVTVTDSSNGCTDVISQIITENKALPDSSFDPTIDSQLKCNNLNIILSCPNANSNAIYSWSNGSTDPTITISDLDVTYGGAETYDVTVTNPNGCSSSNSITITSIVQNPTVSLSLPATDDFISCATESVRISSSVSGHGSDFSYEWSSDDSSPNDSSLDVISGGTYTITVTDNSNGCVIKETIVVQENENPPTAVALWSATTITCSSGSLTLDATGSATDTSSFGTLIYTLSSDGGYSVTNTTGIFGIAAGTEILNDGNYTLIVEDTYNGCTDELSQLITTSTGFPDVNITPNDKRIICGETDITLNATSNPDYNYTWKDNNGATLPNGTGLGDSFSSYTFTSANTYLLEVENTANSCVALIPFDVLIDQSSPGVISAGSNYQIDCTPGSSETLEVLVNSNSIGNTNSFDYVWSTGETSSSITVGLAGDYTVTVTDINNNCPQILTIPVTSNQDLPSPTITSLLGGTEFNCNTNTIVLEASATDGVGDGLSNLSYQWSDGGVSNDNALSILILSATEGAGTYSVTVTNGDNQCASATSISIDSNYTTPVVANILDETLNCFNNGVVTLDGSTSTTTSAGGLSFLWSNGETTDSIIVTSTGTYSLVVTDLESGCTDDIDVNVFLNNTTPLPLVATPEIITCTNSFVQLDASGSTNPNNTSMSYNWSGPSINSIVNGENTANPTVIEGGTYNVIITDDSNGCSASSFAEVPQNTNIPNLTIAKVEVSGTTPDDGILCVGDNLTLSATTNADTYSWTTTAVLNLGAGNDNIPNPSIFDVSTDNSGVYTLEVTDTNTGCTATESIEIVVNSNPQAVITIPDGDVLDCTNNESITLGSAGSTTNGGGMAIYQWSGGSSPNSSMTEITSPGDYVLEIEGQTSACISAPVSVNISLNDTQPIPAIASPGTVTCEIPNVMLMVSNTNNNSSTNLSYNWSTSNGNIVSGGNTSQPTVNQGGTYNVIITDNDNGCSANASVFVPQDTDIPNLSITAVETSGTTSDDGILCVGDNLTLSATTTADTYSWTTTAVLNLGVGNDTIANPVISNISTDNSGIYTVVVTDTNTGCVVTESIEIIVNSNPQAVITIPDGDVLNCTNSESITLGSAGSTTNGGGTAIYEWSGGSSPNSSMTEITSPGDYILEVEGQTSACVSTPVSVNISLNDTQPIPAIASPGTVTCEIPDVVLSVSNTNANSSTNLSYDWSTSGGNIVSGGNTNQPTVNQGGTYNVTITDNVNGCSASASVFVPQDTDIPSLSIAAVETSGTISDDGVLCVGDNLTLSATTTADTYSWTTTANLILGVGNDTIANPVISDVSTDNSGIYTVVVTDTNTGCSVTESIEIIVNSNPQAVITTTDGDVLDCTNSESITLGSAGSTTNGGGAIIYEWSGGSSPNSSTTEITSPGDYILEVEGQSSGCVSAAVSVNILLNDTQPIPAIASPGTVTCQIPNIMLSVSNTNANSSTNLSYDWSTSNGNIVSGGNTSQPTVNQGGTYNVMITDNDNGCSASASVVVPQDTNIPSLSITAVETSGITSDDGILCVGDNLTLSTTTTADIYSWTTTAVLNLINDDIANPFIQNVSTDNSGIYTVVVTDTNTGCSVTESIEIVVNSNPEAVITTPDGDVLDCMNSESITLGSAGSTTNGGGAIIYEWSGGSSPNSSMTEIISPGDYILEVEGQSSGCVSESASVNISLNDTQPIPAIASPGIITCEIPNIMLSVSNTNANSSTNLSYDWSTSDGNIMNGGNTNQPTVNQAGTYNVTITDIVNGCSASASTQVSQDVNIPSLTVAAVETSGTTPDDGILCVGDNLTLSTTTTADTYSWTTTANLNLINDDIANPSIPYVSADNSGIYTVVVTDTNTGCSVTESIEIIVNPLPEPMILVPSIIEEGTAYTFSCNYCDSGEAYNYNYNWNFGSGALPSSLTDSMPSVSYSGQGGVLISLEVTDIGNACSNLMTEEVEIEIPTNCSLSLPNFPAICVGEPLDFSFSFEGSLTGGGPDLSPNVESSTIWNFGSAANQQVVNGDNDPTISFNEAGVYNITVETRDGQGCIASNHIDITVNPLPVIPAILMDSVNISCATDNQTFEIQFPIEAGTAPFTIDAEYEQGGNITGLTSQMLSSAPFNYISESTIPNGAKVTFVVTDSNGCTTNISQTIFCNCGDAPTVEILGNNAACKDEFNEGTYYQAIINDVLGQGIDSIRWDITGGKFIKLIDGTTLNGLQGVGTLTVLGADLDSLGGDEYRHSVYIKFESTAEITVSVYDEGQCLNNDNTVPSFTKMVDVLGDVNPDDDLFVLLKIDTDGLDDLVMFYPKMGLSYKWGRSPITDIPNLEDSSEFLKEVFPTGTTSSFQQYFHFGETVTVLDLDTTAYVYWVDVAESESENTEIGCRKRVYYNGPLAFRTVTETNTVVDEFSLKIIPNPNKGEFKVQVESEILGHHNVEIFDCLGRKIHESSFDKELINQEVRMSLSVAKGMYLVKVSDTEGNRETIKILVK